tara:strand:+ start:2505 stop:2702 length:198 start_codon:yes stop_codon:yes gene_type:complete
MGGLSEKTEQWEEIRFSKKAMMPMWRYNVISMLREAMQAGIIDINNNFLNTQYVNGQLKCTNIGH